MIEVHRCRIEWDRKGEIKKYRRELWLNTK